MGQQIIKLYKMLKHFMQLNALFIHFTCSILCAGPSFQWSRKTGEGTLGVRTRMLASSSLLFLNGRHGEASILEWDRRPTSEIYKAALTPVNTLQAYSLSPIIYDQITYTSYPVNQAPFFRYLVDIPSTPLLRCLHILRLYPSSWVRPSTTVHSG